ncbi:hypothetical protein PHMEG_00010317 [Phytophthora megakarya]|uniref:Uncharacterized protein n=1 Tax=Phytophthora megakarya TaxID=4795 RepID=A0A225WEJ5_9STRA|nr:hypothetical protein PHMEG_00010317 [Phytophthora megakarya]
MLNGRWLLSAGLPYTTIKNSELFTLFRRLSCQPNLGLPARETIYHFAEEEFKIFVDKVTHYLNEKFNSFLQLPLLAVLYDLRTNAANMNVIGVTVICINRKRRLVKLSHLGLPKSFTVNDTTPSARNVENTKEAGSFVVTPGGEFDEARLAKLSQLKDLYNLPAVNIEIDAKTRVGYAVTLLRRRVYNRYALTKYFETAPPSEQSVWNLFLRWNGSRLLKRENINASEFLPGGIRCRERLRERLALRFPSAPSYLTPGTSQKQN